MAKAVESATLEVVDEGLQAVEETVEQVEEAATKAAGKVMQFLKSEGTIRTSLFLLGAGVGAAGAYYVLNAKLQKQYEEIVEKEIAKAKDFYAQRARVGAYSSPESMLQEKHPDEAVKIIQDNEYGAPSVPDPELQMEIDERATRFADHERATPPTDPEHEDLAGDITYDEAENERHNVFQDAKSANSKWDYNEEIAQRSETAPYIISYEEFTLGEEGFNQDRLTYFDGDDTLLDEANDICDIEVAVGRENLRFGHGSKDNKLVYVRNPVTETDFEIVKSDGTYVREVLGFDDGQEDEKHLAHSSHRGKRRFRHEDE